MSEKKDSNDDIPMIFSGLYILINLSISRVILLSKIKSASQPTIYGVFARFIP